MNIQSISTSLPPLSSPEASGVPRQVKVVAPPVQEKALSAQTLQAISPEQLSAAVSSVREYIEPINSNLEFSVNDETDQVIIKVVDRATKEVIRQIPSEEMIAIAKALDSIKGLFIKQHV